MNGMTTTPGGGTYLKRGYGDVQPSRPLFTPLLPFTRPPVEISVRSQDLVWKINVKFCLQNQPFSEILLAPEAPIWRRFSSTEKLRNLINYQFSSPCFWWTWWKSAHRPPLPSRQFIRSEASKFGNPGRTYITEKKLSAPPPPATTRWESGKVVQTKASWKSM